MAVTKQALSDINNEWLNVYDLVGLDVGTPLILQNTGSITLMLNVSAEKPADSATGRHLYPLVIEWLNPYEVGLWVKAVPKTFGLSRLQVDEVGGLDKTADLGSYTEQQSLNIQTGITTTLINESSNLLMINKSENPLEINQILNLHVATLGVEGASFFSLQFIFNVDLTGATISESDAKAYLNNRDGEFINITDSGIEFGVVTNLDDLLNTDSVRIRGGTVSYYSTNQSTSILSVSEDVLINQPYILESGGMMIIRGNNLPVLDGGTELISTALIAGKFTPVSTTPDTLTYDGDTLTYT